MFGSRFISDAAQHVTTPGTAAPAASAPSGPSNPLTQGAQSITDATNFVRNGGIPNPVTGIANFGTSVVNANRELYHKEQQKAVQIGHTVVNHITGAYNHAAQDVRNWGQDVRNAPAQAIRGVENKINGVVHGIGRALTGFHLG